MGEWGVRGDQDYDMDAAVWAIGESEGGCPSGSVWVEGPVVIGLYGLLPTERRGKRDEGVGVLLLERRRRPDGRVCQRGRTAPHPRNPSCQGPLVLADFR